jgi:hypothetical protein
VSTIVLTQGANVCSITATIVYGTDFYPIRLNQRELKTADGADIVKDNGPTEMHGVMVLKNVSVANAQTLRTWLYTYAVFAKNTFTVAAVTGVDWGNGSGKAISTAETPATTTNARYDGGATLEGVFEYVAPGIYNVRLPYRYII